LPGTSLTLYLYFRSAVYGAQTGIAKCRISSAMGWAVNESRTDKFAYIIIWLCQLTANVDSKVSIGHTYHFVIFQNIDIFFLQHLLDLFWLFCTVYSVFLS
jgi:hypothetical protein